MVNAGVPPAARALVMQCAEKAPENRPRGFKPIVEVLRAMMTPQASEKTQAVAQQEKTRPLPVAKKPSMLPWIAGAGVAIMLIAAGAWWFMRPKPEPPVVAVKEQPAAIPGMVYFPAGRFLLGESNSPVPLNAFYLDETEVSNADYTGFCRATGCPAPTGAPDLPVTNVTFAEARQFAAWKGKRLPTAFEWERAARGADGQKYPWGNAEDASRANIAGNALKPVKSYEPYGGLYQMAGNAWEIVDTDTTPSSAAVAHFANLLKPAPTTEERWIEIRGGSFNTPLAAAVGYEWSPIPERYKSIDIGFRCAKTP